MQNSKVMTDQLFNAGRWLLCDPQHFDVKYEINPWMSVSRQPAKEVSAKQWQSLHHHLIRLGAWVEYVQPVPECPDIVYTANAGLIRGNTVVLSAFNVAERRAEEAIFQAWFEAHEYEVKKIESGYFEGEGDALFVGEKLFCGFGFRSTKEAYPTVAKYLSVSDLVLCEMVDPRFYHLDTCFAPLNQNLAIFYPPAFTAEAVREMEKHIELLAVDQQDAVRFVCNAVVLGTNIIMPAMCTNTYQMLAKRGFTCYGVELSEFLKGGGSAKCLSLRLDRP